MDVSITVTVADDVSEKELARILSGAGVVASQCVTDKGIPVHDRDIDLLVPGAEIAVFQRIN